MSNNPELDKILDRVQKLLALANNNPSAEEAATAAAHAASLMAKYSLDTADLQARDLKKGAKVTNAVTEDASAYIEKIPLWYNSLVTGLSQVLGCVSAITRQDGYLFMRVYGLESDVMVTKWLAGYLTEQINRLAGEAWQDAAQEIKMREQRSPWASERMRYKNQYRQGAVTAVLERVREVYAPPPETTEVQLASANALMVVKQDLIRQERPDLPTPNTAKYRITGASDRGARDSERVSVNRVVHGDVREPVAAIEQ